jgi:hypothetical protein
MPRIATGLALAAFGRPRLGTQDLLVRVLPEKPPESSLCNGEILWRILSAFSHSELWTSLKGLRELEDDTQPRALVVHLPTLLQLCKLTLTAHDRAFDRRMQLTGHATWEKERGPLRASEPQEDAREALLMGTPSGRERGAHRIDAASACAR